MALSYNKLVRDDSMPVADAIRKAFGMEPQQLEKLVSDYSGAARQFITRSPLPQT